MADHHYIKLLFLKFLEDKCTSKEVEEIIYYLQTSDNVDALPRVDEVKAKLGHLDKMDARRADEIFDKIIRSDQYEEDNLRVLQPSRSRVLWPVRNIAAAMIGMLMLAGVYLWYQNSSQTMEYATGYGETQKVLLPDGTEVLLNANSVLQLPRAWQDEQAREVWLEGEAFFSVIHTQDHRKFLVHTSHDVSIEVLGTQFNVNSRQRKATVVLNAGKVKVNSPSQHGKADYVMQPGDLIEYESESQRVYQQAVDTALYTSWKDNLLTFKDTPLREISLMIHDTYGYELVFEDDSLAQLQFTGSNPADNLELLLKTLSRSFNFKMKRDGQKILIEEKTSAS